MAGKLLSPVWKQDVSDDSETKKEVSVYKLSVTKLDPYAIGWKSFSFAYQFKIPFSLLDIITESPLQLLILSMIGPSLRAILNAFWIVFELVP